MKKILFAFLLLIPFVSFSQVGRDAINTVNVQWFTGVPGANDVTVQVNRAIAYCFAQRKTQLFFPAAHYKINTATSGVDMLTLPSDTLGIRLFGENGTYFESNSKVNNLLDVVNGPHVGIEIDHIYFLSTHDTTNQGTTCLLFQGFNPNIIKNVKIHDCTFDGWSTDIVLKGVQNGHIYNNTEVSPLGHDNGTTTNTPNVGILSVVDSVGDENKNIEINGNWASGYTGTAAITTLKTHGPKDGWFYGPASGFNIHDNFTFNYGREHIVIQPSITVRDSSITRVERNTIDCRMPPGSANTTNVKLTTVYGIRAEAQNLVIDGNTIYNAPIGIFFDATPWNFVFRAVTITNNKIYGATDTAMNPSTGIYAKGFATGTRSVFCKIDNNILNLDSMTLKQPYKAIQVTFVDSFNIDGNEIHQTRTTRTGGGVHAIDLTTVNGGYIGINPCINVDTFLVSATATFSSAVTSSPRSGIIVTNTGAAINLNMDSTFVAAYHIYKTYAMSDTLWKFVYGIPQPVGSGVNGTQIDWQWLILGGHGFSKILDSNIYVSGASHLLVSFQTMQDVAFASLSMDEQTYPLSYQVIGNLDNYDLGIWLKESGLGAMVNGTGAGGNWQVLTNSLQGYTLAFDTSTIGYLSFDLLDGAGFYLGSSTLGTEAFYVGHGGYHLDRIGVGLTRNYKYRMMDVAGNPVTGSPQAADSIQIFNGSTFIASIDCRQYLTATNPYFFSGLPNFWFCATVKIFPDSLQIPQPANFTVVASGTAGQINTSWSAVSNATSYQVDRSTTPNFSSFTNVYSSTATSFNDTGLTTGTTYYYRLRAVRVANVFSGFCKRKSAVAP